MLLLEIGMMMIHPLSTAIEQPCAIQTQYHHKKFLPLEIEVVLVGYLNKVQSLDLIRYLLLPLDVDQMLE